MGKRGLALVAVVLSLLAFRAAAGEVLVPPAYGMITHAATIQTNKANSQKGLLIDSVTPGGNAEIAGLRPGNIILSVDNATVDANSKLIESKTAFGTNGFVKMKIYDPDSKSTKIVIVKAVNKDTTVPVPDQKPVAAKADGEPTKEMARKLFFDAAAKVTKHIDSTNRVCNSIANHQLDTLRLAEEDLNNGYYKNVAARTDLAVSMVSRWCPN